MTTTAYIIRNLEAQEAGVHEQADAYAAAQHAMSALLEASGSEIGSEVFGEAVNRFGNLRQEAIDDADAINTEIHDLMIAHDLDPMMTEA